MKVAIINCFDTLIDRQESLRRYFLQRGDSVTAYLSDWRHLAKTCRETAPEGYTLIHAKAYHKNISLQRMYSHDLFSKAVLRELEGRDWDLIWVLIPPNSLVKRCAAYKRAHPEVKLVFDVNDLWPETFPMGRVKELFPFQLWRGLRDRHIGEGDYIVTECELFQRHLALDPSHPSTTIYMCKPEGYPVTKRPEPPAEGGFSLCYLGSINHIIDIDAILEIIRSLAAVRPVTLHVIGDGENRDQLIRGAEQSGASVAYHGVIYDPAEKQAVFDQCHFGLNVMKPTVCVGLTMKSIDYMAGALPLINTIRGDTWELVEQRGIGVNWGKDIQVDWAALDLAQARKCVIRFFEDQLTYVHFAKKMDQVLAALDVK